MRVGRRPKRTPSDPVFVSLSSKFPELFREATLPLEEFLERPASWRRPEKIYAWRPMERRDGSPPDSCRVYCWLCERIQACEVLANSCKASERDAKAVARELQDRNLMLAIYMDRSQRYDDAHYLNEMAGQAAMRLFRPDGPEGEKLSFTKEDLPDLTPHLLAADFWAKSSQCAGWESRFPERKTADLAVVRMFTKAEPKPSASRGFPEMFRASWTQDPDGDVTFDLWRRTMAASILGLYEHCAVTADFHVRYAVYAWLFFDPPSKERSAFWMEDNGKLHTYAIRELMFWTSARLSAFDDFMKEKYFWRLMRQNTCSGMDECRRAFNEAFDFGEARLSCGRILEEFNSQNRMYAARVSTVSFQKKVVEKCIAADARARELGLPDVPEPPERDRELMKAVVAKHHDPARGKSLHFDWLGPCFGLSFERVLEPLSNAEKIERAELKQTVVAKVLADVREHSPEEFAVLRYFFQCLEEQDSFSTARLPPCISGPQLSALAEKWDCAPEDVPKKADVKYFCPSCGVLKSEGMKTAKVLSKKAFKRYFDLGSGKVYCSSMFPRGSKAPAAVSKRAWKHQSKSKKAKTAVRKQRADKIREACLTAELLPIHLRGKVASTPAHSNLMTCATCAAPMEWTADKTRNGLPCCCVRKEEAPPAAVERKATCFDCGSASSRGSLAFSESGKIIRALFCERHWSRRAKEGEYWLGSNIRRSSKTRVHREESRQRREIRQTLGPVPRPRRKR